MLSWFQGATRGQWWAPAEGSIAWAYDWLAADREPRQTAAGMDKVLGSKTPPAALALHVYDLRQDLAGFVARWIGATCLEFDLTGPNWWRRRVETARQRRSTGADNPADWRANLPQGNREMTAGQRFLLAWLDRIEGADYAVDLYDEAHDLMVRVASLAPWRARPRRIPGIPCPECDTCALVIYEGDDCVTCQHCQVIITRERYTIWSVMFEQAS